MELLFNDLSIHGQFPDLPTFRAAINRVMEIRQRALRLGRELHCNTNVARAQVTPHLIMPQAIKTFTRDEQQAVMQWLTKHGPFWEDSRVHGADDYLESNGAVVTDTAVGEAAYRCFQGEHRDLVSLTPSSWKFSPVSVTWMGDVGDDRSVDVLNHWDVQELEAALRAAPAPYASWGELEVDSLTRCPNLTFSANSFAPLRGYPFAHGAAKRLDVLLDTLNRFKSCFDANGQRTPEGHLLYQNHFAGSNARFSDSSDTEKHDFRAELTFRHPTLVGESLACTWHGKVKTPQLRIHFSWPVRADEPLYVVYVGPKVTKR